MPGQGFSDSSCFDDMEHGVHLTSSAQKLGT